jgi:hypothetical protein
MGWRESHNHGCGRDMTFHHVKEDHLVHYGVKHNQINPPAVFGGFRASSRLRADVARPKRYEIITRA